MKLADEATFLDAQDEGGSGATVPQPRDPGKYSSRLLCYAVLIFLGYGK